MRPLVALLALSLSVAAQSGFGGQQIITASAAYAFSVYATDLDGDGDADVLSGSGFAFGGQIAWYENLGGGSFGAQQAISPSTGGASSVYAADLDGDGDNDVLSASMLDDRVAWYENGAVATPPCPIGACLDLIGAASIGNSLSLLLQSPAANAPCYVLASSQSANFPLGTVGATTYYSHLALGPGVLALADPSGIFGQSLTNPVTDAGGNWALTLSVPADPGLSGLTFYGEAWVEDGTLLPTGLFWQSNLLALTIQ
ncbi:MAG: VCBS repeat-containing protein [Planctomycetes bacterium]|nr:VCBS repeat-containing protein [Planctomycetota bacterium]